MKKTALFILVALIMLQSGCSNDSYSLEKEYWRITRLAENILKNPHSAPPNEYEKAQFLLNSFISKYPQSGLSIRAKFILVQLFLAEENFQRARVSLAEIMNDFKDKPEIVSEAMFLTGNSYEMEKNWPFAEAEYKKIMSQFPSTARGMSVPLYITGRYRMDNDYSKTIESSAQAIHHYKKLSESAPWSQSGFQANLLVARVYSEIGDWAGAARTLEEVVESYADKAVLDAVMFNLAYIYKVELKDENKSKAVLEKMKENYPQSRFIIQADKIFEQTGGQ